MAFKITWGNRYYSYDYYNHSCYFAWIFEKRWTSTYYNKFYWAYASNQQYGNSSESWAAFTSDMSIYTTSATINPVILPTWSCSTWWWASITVNSITAENWTICINITNVGWCTLYVSPVVKYK
jgi:hypothetical protein